MSVFVFELLLRTLFYKTVDGSNSSEKWILDNESMVFKTYKIINANGENARVKLNIKDRTSILVINSELRSDKVEVSLGITDMPIDISVCDCTKIGHVTESTICAKYNNLTVAVALERHNEISVQCYRIKWFGEGTEIMDCLNFGKAYLYGGGERYEQYWPLWSRGESLIPYITADNFHCLNGQGSVIENYWITSSGFSVFVDRETPLAVSFNDSQSGRLCFSAISEQHPYKKKDIYENRKHNEDLSYTICSGYNIKKVQEFSSKKWFQRPEKVPDAKLFQHPVWSTWAKYKANISDEIVITFANEISTHGFSHSILGIDDKWESCYGEMEFDKQRFGEPKIMSQKLKEMGFDTLLWVHPFCSIMCESFKTGAQHGYWVKNATGHPLLVNWWNGVGAHLDITNTEAQEWFLKRLETLQNKYNIDTFKFDAGEIAWLSEGFVLHDKRIENTPNKFSQLYSEMAHKLGSKVEVRVGFGSQHVPILVRIFDRYSSWDYGSGLKSIIPTVLTLGIIGYPFILPDMIGGNNYGNESATNVLPTKELYIRWVQVNTLLPTLQFSIAPWQYDKETIKISQNMVHLHQKYSSLIISLAEEAVTSGNPIIRPLWWVSPDDPETWVCDSQFLVGNDLLVAPVLEENAQHRDIYLPKGLWREMNNNEIYNGPRWLRRHRANLERLPHFLRAVRGHSEL
ncbi:uncharacterized family 31 glucosidase KIAA1161-like [Limulus polyphemus]|uniref:Uncharacterized family 31 glucosidase KIAA1161-like n=1 Tax=Limulus polyphemus TaxID=6850 RepID=A0ABM1BUA2_LIMPO|nr:uncharacterized family 31 glucosidase KIAA1161-like [Limulus polyphemus]